MARIILFNGIHFWKIFYLFVLFKFFVLRFFFNSWKFCELWWNLEFLMNPMVQPMNRWFLPHLNYFKGPSENPINILKTFTKIPSKIPQITHLKSNHPNAKFHRNKSQKKLWTTPRPFKKLLRAFLEHPLKDELLMDYIMLAL